MYIDVLEIELMVHASVNDNVKSVPEKTCH